MLRTLFPLILGGIAFSTQSDVLGIPPSLSVKYTPSGTGQWTCLDGSKQVPWTAVNDDYCDCPDGSDEPGTGACPNTTFYCQNAGHIGAYISSTRVKDGLCEPECCDGSDEQPGACPNQCKQIGDAYRDQQKARRKVQSTGAKVRASYIAFAEKEKARTEAAISQHQEEIHVRSKEVARLRDIAERSESMSAAALEHKQKSPLYQSLLLHSQALQSLQREHKKHLAKEKTLADILDTLRAGYNPNYQDMAVLEAVRGWESFAGLPSLNDRDNADAEEQPTARSALEEETLNDAEWSAERLEKELDDLLDSDYVSLLLEHDEHVVSPPEGSILFDISAYLPDSIVPQYEVYKNFALSWMSKLGVLKGSTPILTDDSRARQALLDAESSLKKAQDALKKSEKELDEMFSVSKFGSEGEWKKLDQTCLSKDFGDYTYELCLFGEAKQIPNKGGSTFKLGKFSSWNPSPNVTPGSLEYHSRQLYKKGTKCWNGPERSVQLDLECGTENALLTVMEMEKCEYRFTGTSPALCLPVTEPESRDEL